MTNQLYKKITKNAALIDIEGAFPKQEFTWMAEAGLLDVTISDPENNLLKTASLLQLLKKVGSANLSVGRIYEATLMLYKSLVYMEMKAKKSIGLQKFSKEKNYLVFGIPRLMTV